jgi:hypothetical protein
VAAKVAVTVLAADIATEQAPVPVHAPDQPEKVNPAAGVAVRATVTVLAYVAEQVVPQEIPAGTEVTVPEPTTDVERVNDV